ncbi:hypothetical protein JQT66_04470 [Sulfitobacter mediterraneus]|uniref:hypothetical protein n=1 Tax=Sulfitobacter mediterraneus TaxID=83219 RepID=UPI001933E817|nr:hypothetical protein [Sulfitobacter mediterraneus]MBM1309064.1 hypothetical protein [Sulfitobacter mediterraneus]MBM1312948.1 hypothetical protein [Sulfitobacter mediterraneus]MBM1321331.1 hypothetical protein [Sulfitobacter mediterraneus]MBM1325218.1 hypothetical protein [Sulfitobacter mediterraneus]MBM1396565.1 hypothetical protein [Sulfitobacter mediterraneus]
MKRDYDAEIRLAYAENLVRALQILNWQFVQEPIKHGTELANLRDGIVGIGDALEAIFDEMDAQQRAA